MKANFGTVTSDDVITEDFLDRHAVYLAHCKWVIPGSFRKESELPEGFENYYCVDVLGEEFKWMNETFTKDKFKWYLWFESVFLVPEEMVPFLKLRWS
jgi:hypothetical protein